MSQDLQSVEVESDLGRLHLWPPFVNWTWLQAGRRL